MGVLRTGWPDATVRTHHHGGRRALARASEEREGEPRASVTQRRVAAVAARKAGWERRGL